MIMFNYASDLPRLFVATNKEKTEYTRSKAHGYKKITCASKGELTSVVFKTSGDTLEIVETDKEPEREVFCIQCKEFGVIGYDASCKKEKFTSDIGVIFCDDGEMFVTLYNGAIFINLNDELVMPTTSDIIDVDYTEADIYWVDADKLKSFGKYMYGEGKFIYDREYALTISGKQGNSSSFMLEVHKEDDVDLSQGYITTVELKEQERQAKLQNKAIMNNIISKVTQKKSFDFDYEDLADESEEEIDDSEDY